VADDDLLCCVALRNEALRLPYFLDYYRQKGVTQFLIVDNNSTDESGDYLLAQPDVYVWHSTHAFSQANFGAAWFELLLQRYGIGHWTLLVDADELLYYPDCEQQSIQRWCTALEQQGVKAYKAILLDMYADTPVHETSKRHAGSSIKIRLATGAVYGNESLAVRSGTIVSIRCR